MLSLLASIVSCRRAGTVRLGPQRHVATTAEVAIYRLLADSTYIRSTGRPVAVLTTSLDSACADTACAPLVRRWGVESPWWATAADSLSVIGANEALLRRSADTIDLRAVGAGHDGIVMIAAGEIPAVVSDERTWGDFQFYHRGAAGILRFSPVGFNASRTGAVVFVNWLCGPACGHTVVTALRADSASGWRIADMLLLSSRRGMGVVRPE